MNKDLFEARREKLFFYSSYNFLRSIPSDTHTKFIETKIVAAEASADCFCFETNVQGKEHAFYYEFLPWDSRYFSVKTMRLDYVLFDHEDIIILAAATAEFIKHLQAENPYLFIDIPSEDILLIQALGMNGFKLIETRLNYYNDHLADFKETRFGVREATLQDIPALKATAMQMRNIYDRFHAEYYPVIEKADDFLATYVENSINGFADIVMVPNEEGIPADSFLTARYIKDLWPVFNVKASKMVLSAVSASTNRGWYKKLISEMTYHLRDVAGADVIYMNTQSTNRAVIKTWENLGYNFGFTNHILSYYKP